MPARFAQVAEITPGDLVWLNAIYCKILERLSAGPPPEQPADNFAHDFASSAAIHGVVSYPRDVHRRSTTEITLNTEELAQRIRVHAVRMTSRSGNSHIGSILSAADIFAVLYGAALRLDPQNPRWNERDRFILSKGHAGAGVYAALAERGFFPVKNLETFGADGSPLSGHLSHFGIPGVELSTGSLGHGLSVGAGMAYAGHRRKARHRVFVVLSDGECDEGSLWEAALFAGHHRLDNLVAIVDYNKMQSLASTHETLDLEPFVDKWQAFGWIVSRVDGHSHPALTDALANAAFHGRPTCIIADTVKGKGVSFMENSILWHYRAPRGKEFDAAMRELGGL